MANKKYLLSTKKQIIDLHNKGFNKSEISRKTGIHRETVRNWINKGLARLSQQAEEEDLKSFQSRFESESGYYYSYLLGLYLGDGCISESGRTYRIRIFLDDKYPNIQQECKKALQKCFPNNKVNTVQKKGCKSINLYNNNLPDLFPHGPGRKHNRKIELQLWQQNIVNNYAKEFLKGLIHSDGCRFENNYIHYEFSNCSKDIINIFLHAAHNLELAPIIRKQITSKNKQDRFIIAFNKKQDTKKLDKFIRQKN